VSFAADFTVSMPKETSTMKLFWVTFWGLAIPLIFIELMGALAVTTFAARPDWEEMCAFQPDSSLHHLSTSTRA
jgi:purine-cytosine permease-like protein